MHINTFLKFLSLKSHQDKFFSLSFLSLPYKSRKSRNFFDTSPKKTITLAIVFLFGIFLFSSHIYAADPSLSLTPSTSTIYQGQSFSVSVQLNSDNNPHSSSNVVVTFDPAVVQVQSINQGSLYSNFFNSSFDNSAGSLSFEADFFGGSNTNSGQVAVINMIALATGAGNLNFGASTEVLDASSTPYSGSVHVGASTTVLAPQSSATMTLSSAYPQWAIGDQQEVLVSIDSQGNNLAGVDIVLNYDPGVFTFNSASWKGLFPNQFGFSNDATNGVVTISGIAEQSSPFNGSGDVVGFFFQANSVGSGDFSFDWTLDSTTDTNIVAVGNPNNDLLTTNPPALSVTSVNSATLSFQFALANFLGDIITKSGSIMVVGPNVTSAFNNPSSLGQISELALGTFGYGSAYDLVLRVPSYLATKQNQTILAGLNPSSGYLDFGTLIPGDVNQDDVVNTFDLFSLFNNWNATDLNNPADLNGDQKVNSFDVGLLYDNFNAVANL